MKLRIYEEKNQFVIERINQFNHSSKQFFDTDEEVKEALTHYVTSSELEKYDIEIEDNKIWSLVVNHLTKVAQNPPKNPIGRPSIGVTKKVSLTLSEENWEWLDEQAKGNRSNFIREAVWNALGNESEWSNHACLGYAILGAKKLGYDDEKIQELVRAIYSEFDMKSVPEAEDVYRKSDY